MFISETVLSREWYFMKKIKTFQDEMTKHVYYARHTTMIVAYLIEGETILSH